MSKRKSSPAVSAPDKDLIIRILNEQRNQQALVALQNQADMTYVMEQSKAKDAKIAELEAALAESKPKA